MSEQLVENMERGGYAQPQGRMIMSAAAEIRRLRAELVQINEQCGPMTMEPKEGEQTKTAREQSEALAALAEFDGKHL